MRKETCTAIVVAAGQGHRMGMRVQKQFLDLGEGKPILYYPLSCFQKSTVVDYVVLVAPREEIDFCRKEIVQKYGLDKVIRIVPGGKERRDSVVEGLKHCAGTDYVMIHDGARPFVTEDILRRAMDAVREFGACAVGVPAKDTVKLLDDEGFVQKTPVRKYVWMVQTPQCFLYPLICQAYKNLGEIQETLVTDDAMVMEMSGLGRVKMVMGEYSNLKITTPEDLETARGILSKRHKPPFGMETANYLSLL